MFWWGRHKDEPSYLHPSNPLTSLPICLLPPLPAYPFYSILPLFSSLRSSFLLPPSPPFFPLPFLPPSLSPPFPSYRPTMPTSLAPAITSSLPSCLPHFQPPELSATSLPSSSLLPASSPSPPPIPPPCWLVGSGSCRGLLREAKEMQWSGHTRGQGYPRR